MWNMLNSRKSEKPSPWRHTAEQGLHYFVEVPEKYHRHSQKYIAGYFRGYLKRLAKKAPQEETTSDRLWRMFLEAHPQFKGHHYSEPDPGAQVYPYYEAWLHNLIKGLKPEDARRPGEGKAAYRIRTGIH
jgi:hypothetical protein